MNNYKLLRISLTILLVVVQGLIMFGLAQKGYVDYIRGIAITTGLWIIYTFLECKYQVKMSNYIRAMVVITLVSDSFFGYYLNLYATSTVFDKILHVFGIYALSLCAYSLVNQLLDSPVKKTFKFILIVCLGLAIGAFYEIVEFLTDTISHPFPPSQPSLLDTDLDLIGDFSGAVLAGIQTIIRTFIDEKI